MAGPAESVISAARRLIANLITSGETRLRLAVVEWEAERERLLSLLLLAGAGLIMLSFAIGMLLLLIVVMYWEDNRLQAIAICSGVLFVIAAVLMLSARRVAKQRKLMAATLRHLDRDRQALEPSHE
ncbi:phage holin family protein [Salinicola avicenniae]|uniref:phage holin family protein n=1 Tax=Salinicola avicenniae TaxID=2916836 RepID=UPI0020734CE3|nr:MULTISPECIES: phage holin family protein [unclassified Salinicola]